MPVIITADCWDWERVGYQELSEAYLIQLALAGKINSYITWWRSWPTLEIWESRQTAEPCPDPAGSVACSAVINSTSIKNIFWDVHTKIMGVKKSNNFHWWASCSLQPGMSFRQETNTLKRNGLLFIACKPTIFIDKMLQTDSPTLLHCISMHCSALQCSFDLL